MSLQSDGKIVVAGNDKNLVLARYNADGSLDTSFGGGDGFVATGIDLAVAEHSIYIEPSGTIMVGGVEKLPGDPEQDAAVLARFNADGSIDTSYGSGDGVVATDFGTTEDRAVTSAFGSTAGSSSPASSLAIAAASPAITLRWPPTTPTARSTPASTVGIVHTAFGTDLRASVSGRGAGRRQGLGRWTQRRRPRPRSL